MPNEQWAFYREEIEPYLDKKQVHYVGPVNEKEKNALTGKTAAFLMPLEWEEPFGIVMAEAMVCGTPAINTCQGAVPEVVADGQTGFVCDDIDEMVEAVSRTRNTCPEYGQLSMRAE